MTGRRTGRHRVSFVPPCISPFHETRSLFVSRACRSRTPRKNQKKKRRWERNEERKRRREKMKGHEAGDTEAGVEHGQCFIRALSVHNIAQLAHAGAFSALLKGLSSFLLARIPPLPHDRHRHHDQTIGIDRPSLPDRPLRGCIIRRT